MLDHRWGYSVLSKLWSFSIIHLLNFFWFQLMYYWKWTQFWKNWGSRSCNVKTRCQCSSRNNFISLCYATKRRRGLTWQCIEVHFNLLCDTPIFVNFFGKKCQFCWVEFRVSFQNKDNRKSTAFHFVYWFTNSRFLCKLLLKLRCCHFTLNFFGPKLVVQEENSKFWVTWPRIAQFAYFWGKCVYFSIFEW